MTIKENTIIIIIIIELQIQNWISQSLVLLKFNVNLSLNGHLCKLYLLYLDRLHHYKWFQLNWIILLVNRALLYTITLLRIMKRKLNKI